MKTKVIGLRLTDDEIKKLTIRALKRDMGLTDYMRWVLLRKHGELKRVDLPWDRE